MQQISKELNNKEFKYDPAQTLFDIDIRIAIEKKRCPYCFCKLKIPLKGNMLFCKSNKHLKTFIISKKKIK